jgi:preprotein translocase subunit SecE
MAESRLSKTSRFFKEVSVEMQKVTWPTKQELLNATAVVLFGAVLLTAYVGAIDFVMSKIMSLLLTLGV